MSTNYFNSLRGINWSIWDLELAVEPIFLIYSPTSSMFLTSVGSFQIFALLRYYQNERNNSGDFAVFSGIKIDLDFFMWLHKLDQNLIH